MEIVKLYEPTNSRGEGNGSLYTDYYAAQAIARGSTTVTHPAVPDGAGRFFLLKSSTPVSVVGTPQHLVDVAKAAMAKLSPLEREALGLELPVVPQKKDG